MKTNYILLLTFVLSLNFNTTNAQKKPYTSIQVEAKKWVKGNNNTPWEFYKTRIVDNLSNYTKTIDTENKYGSCNSQRLNATGFFRVEKVGDRWWVVDPEGYLNIQRVINGFRQNTSNRNKSSFKTKFGTAKKWGQESANFFLQTRINGTGSWSEDDAVEQFNDGSSNQKLSHSVYLGFMAAYGRKRGGTYQLSGNIGYPNQTIFVFDPQFQSFCDSLATVKTKEYKKDANLFGYFTDNELPFGLKNLEGYLTLENKNDPGRLAAEKWIVERNLSISTITDKEKLEFAGFVADKYFETVSKAIKKADPNHMCLGSRIHGSAKFIQGVMEAAAMYCDVVSINYYGVWTPMDSHLNRWAAWMNKPFIISEFYTKGMDAGLANTTGAGYTVHTQSDRGYAYQDFCLALLESKNCVGWHYFKYQDNDPTAKGVDPSNVDSNKGIVDNDYNPYTAFMDKMQQFNQQVYSLIKYFDN